MGNPLFEMLGGKAQNHAPANMADAMNQLRADPAGMLKNAGYNIPDEIAGDPQAAVMHLLQTGQIGGPMMQTIQPILNGLIRR